MRHTFQWLPERALSLIESDVLAELPALAAWGVPAPVIGEDEVLAELPAIARLQESAR